MAQLSITRTWVSTGMDPDAQEGREGDGYYEVTFTLNAEAGDPATPDHSFDWEFAASLTDGASSGDVDFSDGTSGSVSFSGYGESNSITITPSLDDVGPEADETLRLIVVNLEGTNFSFASGSSPLTDFVIIDECFLEGTNVLTEDGYRRVEDLKIGDKVKTFDGKLEPIKWIGKQTRHRFTAHPLRSLPIQIKAGALGENTPSRDLFVSPDHAVLIDGLLINAGALENGVSIVKTYPTQYTYYHVELENHALLDAEGVPAESFFPQKEDRSLYDNGAEYEELYPHGSKLMLWPLDYPRVSSKNKVPRFVSQKLMQIANQLEGKVEVLTA